MKASVHFASSNTGACSLCKDAGQFNVMSILIHTLEIRTCEKCLPEILQSFQGLTARLETISRKLPDK